MPVNCENSNIIGPGCNFLFAFISVTLAQRGNKPFQLFHSYQPFVSLTVHVSARGKAALLPLQRATSENRCKQREMCSGHAKSAGLPELCYHAAFPR